MANEQNLKPFTSDQSHEKAVENGRKGGIASGKAKREKKDLRLALEMLLEKDFTDKNGNVVSGSDVIATKLFEQAMKGNIKAFTALRDTVGQAPVQKIAVAEVDQNIIDEVERAVLNDETASD